MVDLARKNLLHDKLRFLITVSGVAFAVTLVFVQVGLFLGLLDNASVTIEHIAADLWVTSRNTPNVDFSHPFPENALQRVRSIPGVARADNLIVWFMNIALPSGAQEGTLVYALEDFTRWNLPWKRRAGRPRRPAARPLHVPRRLGDQALRPVRGRRLPRGPAPAPEDHRPHARRAVVHHHADRRSWTTAWRRQLNPDELGGQTTYILVKLAPGADLEAVRAEIAPPPALQRRLHRAASGRRARAATGWRPPASASTCS